MYLLRLLTRLYNWIWGSQDLHVGDPYFTYSSSSPGMYATSSLQERADWLYYYTHRSVFYGSFWIRSKEPKVRLEIFTRLDAQVLLHVEHKAFQVVAHGLELPSPCVFNVKKLIQEEITKNTLA